MLRRYAIAAAILAASLKTLGAEPAAARESARGIPLAERADVVVVGGTTGAVAAAVAAAEKGANVFLVAPFPYLGEDMTATLRLWLEEGEEPRSPLARAIFSERPAAGAIDPSRLVPFTYAADRPSAGVHKDADPPSRLRDGRSGGAARESVQYDGDVTITVRLVEEAEIEEVRALAYHARDYLVSGATVSTSPDGSTWTEVSSAANPAAPQASVDEPAIALRLPIGGKARHLRVAIRKAEGSTRVLVGEIAVIRKGPADPRPAPVPPARPLHVKKVLDEALIAAGVRFLYSSYATDVLEDRDGNPAGVVIANRSGRQAVAARAIIDATERAVVAQLAGAASEPFVAGPRTFRWTVIGGEPRTGPGVTSRRIAPPFFDGGRAYDIIEYSLEIPIGSASPSALAEAENRARDLTYHPGQEFTSDALSWVPPDPIRCRAPAGAEGGLDAADLGAFRPAGIPRLLVLGGRAGVSRAAAERILRPGGAIDLGTRIGIEAAREAASLADPAEPRVRTRGGDPVPADRVAEGDVREVLTGFRAMEELRAVPQAERPLPILGSYDVVVVGGGTSGAPAGIAAARAGARVLVLEYLHGLGGVGTQGAISKYYWGNRVGFSAEVPGGASWRIEERMEWWRAAIRKAGGEIWFGAMGCGAFVQDGRVAGALVATPEGRGAVLARVVIDATGNSDVAAAAGAPCIYTDETDIAMQGAGLPPRRLGSSYTNTDFTLVDETDILDVSRTFVAAKAKAGDEFDLGKLVDTRERRRIAGEFTITILDAILGRTYPDTVVECLSDFDTHGYTVDPYFVLEHPPHGKGYRARVPYRSLTPRGLEGILVVGLGLSAHRDAVPLIRMQPDVQNCGYAAGLAAAMAAREGKGVRGVDVRALQKRLVDAGNLSEGVLLEKDSFPLAPERIAAAVEAAGEGKPEIAAILSQPETALPLLRRAHEKAAGERRLIYSRILAVLGDPSGVPDLIAALDAAPGWDDGWRYTSQGQFGPNASPLDRLIYALGRTGDRRAAEPIARKAALLRPEDAFSHFRAIALAFEMLGDPTAARVLAGVLKLPGVRGHAAATIGGQIESSKKWPSWNATEPRSNSIRELLLGRALFRLGDLEGLGRKVLEEYSRDLRGHLARHARAVLRAGANAP